MERRQFIRNMASFGALASVPLTCSIKASAARLDSDLTGLSATDLSLAIRSKHASCVEVMQAYLGRIHRLNPVYNAIVSMVDDDDLMHQANEADAALARGEYRGWMHGMPHAVKDLAAVKGLPYTSGSPIFADRIAEEDTEFVARIRGQGAIFIGKTNTPEFGLGSQSYNPVFGATGSACNPDLTAGGSSGGAASGLGTHMLPVADGSDMMGSLRNPGAFNNVIGFRPSTNVMSDEPGANERALWTSGPMGRNTRDAINLLQTMAPRAEFNNIGPLNLEQVKIGWMGNFDGYLAMEQGILELCEASLLLTEGAGAHVEAMQPDFTMSDLWQCWTTLRHAGRVTNADLMQLYNNPATQKRLKPELIWEIEQGFGFDEHDIETAKTIRANWYKALDRMFGDYDFLALPTAQVFPFSKDIHWPDQVNGRVMDTYHRWMESVIPGSLGGLPVINVPVGFDKDGRPMGMQIMGRFGDDKRVLAFGLAYEQITDYLSKNPV